MVDRSEPFLSRARIHCEVLVVEILPLLVQVRFFPSGKKVGGPFSLGEVTIGGTIILPNWPSTNRYL